jgi:uncharacterized protein
MREYIYLLAPTIGWLVAQACKTFVTIGTTKFKRYGIFQSGGMPSSHSASMVALATVIGANLGFKSVIFALALTLTAIVVYDAVGVRRTVGEHTHAFFELAGLRAGKLKTKIHDARGHSIAEVTAGVLTGLVVGLLLNYIL